MKFMDAASDFEALMMFDDLTTEADKFFSDSDCSFYEIESHSPLMFKTTGKEASSYIQSSKISMSQSMDTAHGSDRRAFI
jgi:hypothetical protein